MADLRYNTLIIIEGESREKSFFTKLCELISVDKNTTIIPFCNDIYELYKKIEELDFNTTTLDVILKYVNIDDELRENLKTTKFVNTYLVFDLDLQNNSEDRQAENLNKVCKMIELFNDETGYYGKLFVNYPMMESYRHFLFSNCDTLKNKLIEAKNEILTNYKSISGQEGSTKNIKSFGLHEYNVICKAHLMQANLLLNKTFKKPNLKQYEQIIDIKNIHKEQSAHILNEKTMFVLNTSSYIYSEFYPQILRSKN